MNRPDLRERLLDVESASPELMERYHRQLERMIGGGLSGWGKLLWGCSALLGFTFFAGYGAMAIVSPPELSAWSRAMLVVGSIFGLGWTVLGVLVLRKGSCGRQCQRLIMGFVWSFILLLLAMALVWTPQLDDPVKGNYLILGMLAFLLTFGIWPTVMSRISGSEQALREEILYLRLQLEEIKETLDEQREGID